MHTSFVPSAAVACSDGRQGSFTPRFCDANARGQVIAEAFLSQRRARLIAPTPEFMIVHEVAALLTNRCTAGRLDVVADGVIAITPSTLQDAEPEAGARG